MPIADKKEAVGLPKLCAGAIFRPCLAECSPGSENFISGEISQAEAIFPSESKLQRPESFLQARTTAIWNSLGGLVEGPDFAYFAHPGLALQGRIAMNPQHRAFIMAAALYRTTGMIWQPAVLTEDLPEAMAVTLPGTRLPGYRTPLILLD